MLTGQTSVDFLSLFQPLPGIRLYAPEATVPGLLLQVRGKDDMRLRLIVCFCVRGFLPFGFVTLAWKVVITAPEQGCFTFQSIDHIVTADVSLIWQAAAMVGQHKLQSHLLLQCTVEDAKLAVGFARGAIIANAIDGQLGQRFFTPDPVFRQVVAYAGRITRGRGLLGACDG